MCPPKHRLFMKLSDVLCCLFAYRYGRKFVKTYSESSCQMVLTMLFFASSPILGQIIVTFKLRKQSESFLPFSGAGNLVVNKFCIFTQQYVTCLCVVLESWVAMIRTIWLCGYWICLWNWASCLLTKWQSKTSNNTIFCSPLGWGSCSCRIHMLKEVVSIAALQEFDETGRLFTISCDLYMGHTGTFRLFYTFTWVGIHIWQKSTV
jgi:hypothetical protein